MSTVITKSLDQFSRWLGASCKNTKHINIITVKVIKIGTLRWLPHVFKMQELDPCRKLTLLKPESTRPLGNPKLRWLGSVEEDLKKMGVAYW